MVTVAARLRGLGARRALRGCHGSRLIESRDDARLGVGASPPLFTDRVGTASTPAANSAAPANTSTAQRAEASQTVDSTETSARLQVETETPTPTPEPNHRSSIRRSGWR